MNGKFLKLCILTCLIIEIILADKPAGKKAKSWKDKDILDMTDADMERLLDQWEEGDDPLEPDELPEHLRPAPKIDMTQLDTSDPDNILRMTKQGKGVMMFVDVIPEKTPEEAEVIMKIWQGSLMNNHIIAERYPIDQKRSVFLFREGSQAVDAKQYLLEQPECKHITLEGQTFEPKRTAPNKEKDSKKKSKKPAKTEL
ncbi:LDLR chaperone boca [Venturia canescens]|uniref:LDLR chaperone boca n=1 Tax=Venturia canescens TaxID=32260 RepID=UPI001C9BC3C7|nr:LDLR chaperone boca [Venturia canescens]